jgi:hypothetical protein
VRTAPLVVVPISFSPTGAVTAKAPTPISPGPAMRPARSAGTMVIDPAALESAGFTTTSTFSPSDRFDDELLARRSVTLVEELIAYVNEVPSKFTKVIEEGVRAVTSPPTPDSYARMSGAVVAASFELRAMSAAAGLDGCVAALATPTPLTSTVAAIAEESPTCRRTLFRDFRFMGLSLPVSVGGFRDRDIFPNECVDAIGTA